MTVSLLFDAANLFVLPFWALMIVAPNWKVTRRVMASYLPFIALALVYLYLVAGSLNTESLQAMSNPKLADIARFFGTEQGAAAGWVHYLVFDLFVGRWIYFEGQRTAVWTIHSLILCLFFGPFGLLSHILTAWVSQKGALSASADARP
ncbi:ABA4-like family protein [Gloeobacter violaceus]|uniref:Glr3834 protein n=1 Tax=Gloeobacter violaceus (strain ATCC 29082 / PCC 7421) TaxID=251221 RepID=Q7NEP4_GLOVI|nr:ABA4-like family protein [Gloeobacter violaceus]BAC91775.1 glr3834 [Gloeobacter violaceus PCC 7421]